MQRWRVVLATVALLSGCLARDAGPVETSKDADLAACRFTFPDATPLDCEKDELKDIPTQARPDGWFCMERHKTGQPDSWIAIWSDLQGSWGIEFQLVPHIIGNLDPQPTMDFVGDFRGLGEVDQRVTFRAPRNGFVRFPEQIPLGQESFLITFWEFWVNGTPSHVGAENLIIRSPGSYEGDPWFLWDFQVDGTRLLSTNMIQDGSEIGWRPSFHELEGPGVDLWLSAFPHTQDLIGEDSFTGPRSLPGQSCLY